MSSNLPAALVLRFNGIEPDLGEGAWIAPGSVIAGAVKLGAFCTVLFNCVIRGDVNRIEVGEGSNIQDLSMLHVADDWPCIVGSEVTVGHCALLHGCVVEDGCLIGMGARILNGAVIGKGSIVAAGSLVPEGFKAPAGSLIVGMPAQVKGPVTQTHLQKLGALEEVDLTGLREDLRGLPGVAFARKYRAVAAAYRDGSQFRK